MAQRKEVEEVLTWIDGGGEVVEGEVGRAVKIIPVWNFCDVIVGIVVT
jgi:hypothetical protein